MITFTLRWGKHARDICVESPNACQRGGLGKRSGRFRQNDEAPS
jgi:hypothetical protein